MFQGYVGKFVEITTPKNPDPSKIRRIDGLNLIPRIGFVGEIASIRTYLDP